MIYYACSWLCCTFSDAKQYSYCNKKLQAYLNLYPIPGFAQLTVPAVIVYHLIPHTIFDIHMYLQSEQLLCIQKFSNVKWIGLEFLSQILSK